MQIWFLTPLLTWLINIVSWVMIHLGLGYLCSRIPLARFDPSHRFYKSFRWEHDGKVYEKIFHVRKWKHLVPQGSRVYKGSFSLQHLNTNEPAYLMICIQETIRAEFCHWIMILPSVFFVLWNSVVAEFWIVVYAVTVSLFPIVMQRYNRPRFRSMLDKQLASVT